MAWEAGRDSQARPGAGDSYKESVPGGFSPNYASSDELNEQDYRDPSGRGGPGRPNVTAPPSTQMQPEDKGGYPVAGHGGTLGPGVGHGK